MADAFLLLLALLSSLFGMGLLALAMKPHWQQARAPRPYPAAQARTLRVLAGIALALHLALCLTADHAPLAALVSVMMLTLSAAIIAFTLAYRPRWLGWLVAWLR